MPPSQLPAPTPNEAEPKARSSTLHRWLLVLPFVWQVAAVPWANGVRDTIFSMPFLMVWQMAGVLFSTAIIGLVYRLDRKQSVVPAP